MKNVVKSVPFTNKNRYLGLKQLETLMSGRVGLTVLGKWLPCLLFTVLSLPLVWQDLKDNSVSLTLLAGVFLTWSAFALLGERTANHMLAASTILLVGSLLLAIFPGRLGEADIVFMSGMALLLPFSSLLMSFVLGCSGTLLAFVWLSHKGGADSLTRPLPFLPSLYWAGLSMMLVGIRI